MHYADKITVNGKGATVIGIAPKHLLVKFADGTYEKIAR